MSSITTMVYDNGAPKRSWPTVDCSRAIVGEESVPRATITLAYDSSSAQTRCVDVDSVVTTCTYVEIGHSGLENRARATYSNWNGGGSLESQLIAKLLTLLRNPPQTGQPLWWHVWKTVAEAPWLRAQQFAIGRRLIRDPQLIEEMFQVSTIHLGQLFERSPSLGLASDELPWKFLRWIRRIIRRDFITWLRIRSRQRRRLAPWPASDFAEFPRLSLTDELEITAAMGELPALHRDVIEMRSYGYQRAEIAMLLNLSIYQVDRIFASCQEHLRRRLKALRPD